MRIFAVNISEFEVYLTKSKVRNRKMTAEELSEFIQGQQRVSLLRCKVNRLQSSGRTNWRRQMAPSGRCSSKMTSRRVSTKPLMNSPFRSLSR